MTRRSLLVTLQTVALVLLISMVGVAQPQDRAKLRKTSKRCASN